jgi:hypothetical protein
MNPLFAPAAEVQQFCREHGWRSTIIRGLAVQRWGEPRQTRDVDLALLTGLGGETRFVDRLLAHYRSRVANARQFALANRVLLLETVAGVPIDVSLAALPFEERAIKRSTPFLVDEAVSITTCSAEDLVVLKVIADRIQDWLDIEGVIVRQGSRLDRQAVLAELRPLLELKEDLSGESKLQALFAKHRVR